MNLGNNLQTFYVSKENSNCPFIPEIIRVSNNFKKNNLSKNVDNMIFSMKYIKRLLINSDKCNYKDIKMDDFLEIVDYDPVKKVILAIGPKEPCIETPIHWLIQNARSDVNAIIQLNDKTLADRFEKKLPTTEKDYPSGTLEQAKEILKILRNSKTVVIKNQGILFVGNSIKEAETLLLKTFEESK